MIPIPQIIHPTTLFAHFAIINVIVALNGRKRLYSDRSIFIETFTHHLQEVSLPALPHPSARNGLENAYSQFVKMAMFRVNRYVLFTSEIPTNPPIGCQMEDLRTDEISRLHNYAPIRVD